MKKILTLFSTGFLVCLFVTLNSTFSKNQNRTKKLLIVADEPEPMEALIKGLQVKGDYTVQYTKPGELVENLSS